MFGFLVSAGTEAADPLTDVAAVEAFWRALPRDDPLAAQRAVCAALADAVARGSPNVNRMRALLALDQRAQRLIDALLLDFAPGNCASASLGTPSWQAAFELCRSFARSHGQLLRAMPDGVRIRGGHEYLPYLLLRLFQHRQAELLLRPFVDEGTTRFVWKELHEAHRFARSRDLLHHEIPINRCHSSAVEDTTLEREYIHVLLQDLMNGGHFPPHDAFWVSRNVPRWSGALALRPDRGPGAQPRFVVDAASDAGLARSSGESAGAGLGLDTASMLETIRDEIASLRDVAGHPDRGTSFGRGRQVKMLRKISVLCAPQRPVIERRGEREPTALTVEVAVGLAQIVRSLRDKPDDVVLEAPPTMARREGAADGASEGSAQAPMDGCPLDGSTVTQGSPGALGAVHARLTMVDHSDSGCRLHGQTYAANPIVPGVLIAFRDDAASPWTLAVVRRARKRLAGRRVEIGVEYLGRDPRRVIVVVPGADAESAEAAGGVPPRFAALFLPESDKHPGLPIKTLVLPVRGLAPEDLLSVRSRSGTHTIQLKEPLEEQADFLWSPFEILERRQRNDPAPVESRSEVR